MPAGPAPIMAILINKILSGNCTGSGPYFTGHFSFTIEVIQVSQFEVGLFES